MSKKIFVTRQIPDKGIILLKEKGYEVTMFDEDRIISKEELFDYLKKDNYDAVVSQLTHKIDSEIFDTFPNIKIYANYATGYDNIDIESAKNRGITITNAPAKTASNAVAEFTLALMYSLTRRVVEADYFTRSLKYTGWNAMHFIGEGLSGKTLGIIGAGHIGEKVSLYAKGAGMNILYFDIKKNEYIEKDLNGKFIDSVEEIIKVSDVVSLHTPLLPETKHLINKEKISLMKDGAILINTSRGQVVDEEALSDALLEKRIRGAALDVFENEPNINPKLLKCSNVILTPHIASANMEAREEMSVLVANNIIDFFEGKKPQNSLF